MFPAGDILGSHADLILDLTTGDALPEGWRTLAGNMIEGMVAVLRGRGVGTLQFMTLEQKAGGLAAIYGPVKNDAFDVQTADELEALVTTARDIALRTCDACGRGGVFRRQGDGSYAVRCDHHAHRRYGSGTRIGAIASVAPEVLENLLRSHAWWLDRGDAEVDVPPGWIGLMIATLRRMSRLHKRVGMCLVSVRPSMGRLEVRIRPTGGRLSRQDREEVLDHLCALGDASCWTCEICGGDGHWRSFAEGTPTPRCDAHADGLKWPSLQREDPPYPRDQQDVISSARPVGQLFRACVRATGQGQSGAGDRTASPSEPDSLALYELGDVEAALGLAGDEDDETGTPEPRDNEHQARLRRLLDKGDPGRWRSLVVPTRDQVGAIDELERRAPHLGQLASVVRRHLKASMTIGLAICFPPLLVVGAPGVGKTWFLSRLAQSLGIPFRSQPMSSASHADGIGGAHPVWRNSQPGLIAKTLLGERVANPLVFIDEFDKVPPNSWSDDLYRPFYSLLEPIGARSFVDAYLSFPIDASHVNWVLAANDALAIPLPILDRVTIIEAPAPDESHMVEVARSIYADANLARRRFFPPEPSPEVIARFAGLNAREIRLAVEDAMTTAAADGRRELKSLDVTRTRRRSKARYGFV